MSMVSVRSATESDLPAIDRIYEPYVLETPITFDVRPRTSEETRTWFEAFRPTGRHRLWVAEVNGAVVGFAHSKPIRPKAAYETSIEVTAYVDRNHVGGGVGSALYSRLFEDLSEEDIHMAFAGVVIPNEASVRFHERFGFRHLGTYQEIGRKLGRYWDVAWFQKKL
ncbi:MAG: N-acetyltransferase family protein [Planctomycetota bacterium]